jgi:peptide deformylase
MHILTVPHSALISSAKIVKKFDDDLSAKVLKMSKLLLEAKDPAGVGLAANQVNLLQRIFLMRNDEKSPIQVIINPNITSILQKTPHQHATNEEPLEGCLSIPRIWAPVQRAYKISATWQDVYGEPRSGIFEGFPSAVFQHELDHLDGILFTQRAFEQKVPIYEERNGKLHEIHML